jgi:hypothetical protein
MNEVRTLHAVDGDAITVNNFRSGYDESDDFKVRMKCDDRCGANKRRICRYRTVWTRDNRRSWTTHFRCIRIGQWLHRRVRISVSRCPLNHVVKWTRGHDTRGVWTEIRMAYRLGGSPIKLACGLWRTRTMDASTRFDPDQKVTLVKDTLMRSTRHERRMVP